MKENTGRADESTPENSMLETIGATMRGEVYPPESVLVCYEAYQVVGSLLSDLGKFGTSEADKILDNLSAARLVHKDILPWESCGGGVDRLRVANAKLRGALDMVRETLNGATVDDLLYIINTALAEDDAAAKMQASS